MALKKPENSYAETGISNHQPNTQAKLNFSVGFGLFLTLGAFITLILPLYSILSLLAIGFCLYGRYEIKKTGEKGRTLALVCIILNLLPAISNFLLSLRMWN